MRRRWGCSSRVQPAEGVGDQGRGVVVCECVRHGVYVSVCVCVRPEGWICASFVKCPRSSTRQSIGLPSVPGSTRQSLGFSFSPFLKHYSARVGPWRGLPSVPSLTLGKTEICRVPYIGHSASLLFHAIPHLSMLYVPHVNTKHHGRLFS